MKFVVSSTELLSRLQSINRVISTKTVLPILDNFLFELTEEGLVVIASDLETTMRTRIALDNVEGQGKVAIEAKRLTDILKEFPEQPLIFEINNESYAIDILSDNGRFSIMGQDGGEYPDMPSLAEENTLSINMSSDALLKGIEKTIFATASDDLRPVMNGILMQFSEEGSTFVASDAHKLVRYKRKDVTVNGQSSFILPKKPASLLKNILPKESGEIRLQFDDKNAYFNLSDYELICRLVEGSYPNYETVIPTNNPNKLTVNRLDFVTIVKRVATVANQASNLIKLELNDGQVVVSAQDIDFSMSGQEKLSAQYEGEAMGIGFKSSFLVDILNAMSSENVVLQMSDPSRAGIITPLEAESENEDELMLLMPMMVNDEF